MSAITRIGDLDIDDPGCVHAIREHLASGCPLEPLVEAVVPMSPEERAPLVAALVAKANHLIAIRNEANNDAQFPDMSRKSLDGQGRGRGRPKSTEKAERSRLAEDAGVSERTIRRDAAKLTPAEPLVPKPQKPKPVEERLAALVTPLEGINAEMSAIRQSMDEAAKQFRWGANDVRWRYLQELGRANSKVATAKILTAELSERMRSAKAKVFMAPTRQLGDKPAPGPGAGQRPLGLSDPPRVGLRRPELPTAKETADAWADASEAGVGPDDDGEAF